MPLLPDEQTDIEQYISRALRDISHPNPYSLKAGLRILMTTNLQTFETICSENVKRALSDFTKLLLTPEALAPNSTNTTLTKTETLIFIKSYTLKNLSLLDNRVSILPNTYTIKKTIMEGERLKSVVHTSALINVEINAHYVDTLEEKFKKAGISPKEIQKYIEHAIDSTRELHKAVLEGNISNLLKNLSVPGVDPNLPDELGMTPLHLATREGHTETVKVLLTVPTINIHVINNNGWTPLHLAARMGFADSVDALLTPLDANPNVINSDGWSPLHWAAWHGFTEVVTVLLTAEGIRINPTDRNETTPLHWAARQGQSDVITVLLSIPGILVNPQDIEKKTPLHQAAQFDHVGAVKALLDSPDIEVNLTDIDGLSPLHWAALNGQVEILKALLTHRDILVEERDNTGMTPLDWAIRNGNTASIKILDPHFKHFQKRSFFIRAFQAFINFFRKTLSNDKSF